MSTSNINNSVYEFNIALVNTKTKEELYLPIPKGAIEYLELEDSLANFGMIGKCSISNFYGILQQLKILDIDGLNCMYISIKNKDFEAFKVTDPDIYINLLTVLTKSAETSRNIIDKSLNFTLEEYTVARTRMKSVVGVIGDLPSKTDSPGTLIWNLFHLANSQGLAPLTPERSLITPNALVVAPTSNRFVLTNQNSGPIALGDIYDGVKVKSIFDLISELYGYVSYSNGPAILHSSNNSKNERELTLQPLANLTVDFYRLLREGNIDLHEYVTDTFIIGDSGNSNTLNTNFIDEYSFIRADLSDVLAEKWINFIVTENNAFDLSNHNVVNVTYADVRRNYTELILNNTNPNLPDRSTEKDINTKVVHKKIPTSKLSESLAILRTTNTMAKSFVFDNTAITFSVPGNTYRRAGKFIEIKARDVRDILGADERGKAVTGFWFIISIKHIFKGDYYTNEYTCVRLTAGGQQITSSIQQPIPSPTSIPTPAPTTGAPDPLPSAPSDYPNQLTLGAPAPALPVGTSDKTASSTPLPDRNDPSSSSIAVGETAPNQILGGSPLPPAVAGSLSSPQTPFTIENLLKTSSTT